MAAVGADPPIGGRRGQSSLGASRSLNEMPVGSSRPTSTPYGVSSGPMVVVAPSPSALATVARASSEPKYTDQPSGASGGKIEASMKPASSSSPSTIIE